MPAKTRPYGKDPAYNRKTGNRREAWRLAAEAVVAMTARTTQPRPSEGPLGKRGRRLQERSGVVPAMGYHAPGHSAGQAACLTAMSCGGGEGGRPTLRAAATFGLVGEPVAAVGGGMLPLIGACFQPDWGEPNVRLIGGREETGASRLCRAACGASRLPDTLPRECPRNCVGRSEGELHAFHYIQESPQCCCSSERRDPQPGSG